jgi:hypothetical protein
MIKRGLLIVFTVLLLVDHAGATTLDGRCDIRFFAASTLHRFDGQGACQPFSLNGETAASGGELVRNPVINIPVKEMDTDNSGRDKKMQAMFESDRYPLIQARFKDLDPEAVLQQLQETGDTSGHLDFDLQIRQATRTVQAMTRDLQVTPEQISFRMEFTLSLADFLLEPPSVLGMIRVDDQVHVETMVFLARH